MTRLAVAIERALERLVPLVKLVADESARLRLRLLVGTSVLIGLLALPYVGIYALGFGAVYSPIALAIVGVDLLATPLVLRITRSRTLASNWFLANMFAVLIALSSLDGGVSPAMFAFCILPVFASVSDDNRGAVVWAVLSIAAIFGLATADALGVPFVEELSERQHLWFAPAVAIGIVLAVAAPAMLHRMLADRALELARAKEAEVRAIVETTADGIIALDGHGVIVSANRAATTLFDDALVGRSLPQLLGEDFDPESPRGTLQVELGGRNVDLAVTIGAMEELPGRVATVRDVTTEREAERAIAAARDRAIEATRAKSTFLANMSHELRTPLNAIIGYSELLAEDASQDAPEMTEDLERICEAGRHLLALIDDVLDLSKIEAGRLELLIEPLDLVSFANGVVDTARPLAQRKGNELVLAIDEGIGEISGDRTRIRQILLNLLGNAAKFTVDGTIELRIERDGDDVRFTVRDTGIGIPSDRIEAVFGEFVQVDASTTRSHGGTGLGLAITRRLARLMGGDVRLESAVSEGSSFEVRLPAAPQTTPLVAASEVPLATAPDGPPVLVIDDDPAARQLLERALTRGGWGVVSAADGPTGIGICRELQPIAVTLDVLMPGMDGWQVLGALKEDPLTAQIPVILVSMVEDRKLGFTLGASDYLVKPVSKDVLLAAIEPYRKSRGRVLVVEDDDAFRLLLVRTLERAGWSVEHVCNGAEGVLALETTAPDVVIVDLMMPVMDGFELLATMRSDLRWEAIPAVVVTARELSVDERARLNLHASEVLRKAATDCDRLLTRVIQAVATVAKGVSCDAAPSRLASQATRGR